MVVLVLCIVVLHLLVAPFVHFVKNCATVSVRKLYAVVHSTPLVAVVLMCIVVLHLQCRHLCDLTLVVSNVRLSVFDALVHSTHSLHS